jgi:adenylate cyclase
MMLELDGFQVLQQLSEAGRLTDLPVIMISAVDEVQSVARCIELGIEDYLTKPFDSVLLRARIGAAWKNFPASASCAIIGCGLPPKKLKSHRAVYAA